MVQPTTQSSTPQSITPNLRHPFAQPPPVSFNVWLISHRFANEQQTLSPAILRSRFIGEALMLAAILLIVLR